VKRKNKLRKEDKTKSKLTLKAMSIHEKMQSDYLWVKNHNSADSSAKTRTPGYNFIGTYNELIESDGIN